MAAPEYSPESTPVHARQLDSLIRLFNRSILKQHKYRALTRHLGSTEGLVCLDIGSGNGVISHLLRQHGGDWTSADLTPQAVAVIRRVVGDAVQLPDGGMVPFSDGTFDRVVIIDYLEHIADDGPFMAEVYRILRSGGRVVINVPHRKKSLLRALRHRIGQTDARHGHVRPGYALVDLQALLGEDFTIQRHETYSKFFTELIDTLINFAVALLKRGKSGNDDRAVTVGDVQANPAVFWLYGLLYPLVWLFSRLDALLFFRSGYMLIVTAQSNKMGD